MVGWLVGSGSLVGWLDDCLGDWLTGWLVTLPFLIVGGEFRKMTPPTIKNGRVVNLILVQWLFNYFVGWLVGCLVG